MSAEEDEVVRRASGPLVWMAKNSVAANVLMLIFVLGGLMMIPRVKQEVFPEFDLDLVLVNIAYPGASPSEVEQGVILPVEEAVRAVDGIKEVRSTAQEGVGVVSAGADPRRQHRSRAGRREERRRPGDVVPLRRGAADRQRTGHPRRGDLAHRLRRDRRSAAPFHRRPRARRSAQRAEHHQRRAERHPPARDLASRCRRRTCAATGSPTSWWRTPSGKPPSTCPPAPCAPRAAKCCCGRPSDATAAVSSRTSSSSAGRTEAASPSATSATSSTASARSTWLPPTRASARSWCRSSGSAIRRRSIARDRQALHPRAPGRPAAAGALRDLERPLGVLPRPHRPPHEERLHGVGPGAPLPRALPRGAPGVLGHARHPHLVHRIDALPLGGRRVDQS